MKRALYALPLVALSGLAALAGAQLFGKQRGDFENALRAAPSIEFETLDGAALSFSPPPHGKPAVVNLFASWCGPCEAEHPYLVQLGLRHPESLYGVLYKDTPENGADFLARLGNPYVEIALDPEGQGGLDFGLTGVPETFVVSGEGEILLHVQGPLSQNDLSKIDEALRRAPR
jgi:cytochrome c biogenesis protein CcmG/thiol:disulfide interchange protein DsbE